MVRQSKGITLPIIYKSDMGGLNTAAGGLERFGLLAARVGLAVAAAFAGVAIGGVKMAVDLEQNFAKIQGLVGLSAKEVDVLREAAKRLGPEFGQSANDAAEALFFITSAGLRGSAAIDVLEASLKGSAIGLGETRVIADLATSAVNAYGEANLDGATAVDVLAEAVRLGKLEPAELAGSMGQVLPIASSMGISFAEVGAAMAAMSRTGTDASQASTQLRGIMTAILKPTTQAERALRDMGTSSEELRQSIRDRGLLKTLQDLTGRFDGNESATAAVFGNVRALSGVLDLFGENAETTMEILSEMTDDVGVLDEAFEIMQDTVGFKAKQAFEEMKGVMLELGDALLPLVNDLLVEMAPLLRDMAEGAREFIETKLVPFIQGLETNEDFQSFLGTTKDLLFDIVPKVVDFAKEAAILATNLSTLLKPAFEGLVGDKGVMQPLGSILGNINFFMGELNKVQIPGMDKNWEELLNTIGLSLSPLKVLGNRLRDIAFFLDLIRRGYEKLLEREEEITQYYQNLGQVIKTFLDEPLASIRGTFETMGQVFSNAFQTLFGITEKGVDDQNKPFRSGGPNLTASSTGFITNVLSAFQRFWPNISGFVSRSTGALPGTVSGFAGRMGIAGGGLIDSLRGGMGNVWGNVSNWLRDRANDISNRFSGVNLRGIGENIINSLLGGLQSKWDSVWKWVRDKAKQIADTFAAALKIDSPSKVFFEFGENILEGLTLGLKSESPSVDAVMGSVVPSMPSVGSAGGGGNVYNVTVNAGMGADGAEVGRKVVDAIRAYERRSGKVFAAA
jgi:TP901 family phage tail tape measure protein